MATPVVEDPRPLESISARSKTLTPSLKLASALQVSPAISTGPTRAVTSPRTRHVPKMVRAFVVREHERQARGLQRLVVPTLTEARLGEKPIRLRQHVIASRAGQVDRLTEQPLRLLVFAEAEAGAGEVAQAQDLLRSVARLASNAQRLLVAVPGRGVIALEPQRLAQTVEHHADRLMVAQPAEDRERLLLATLRLFETSRDLVGHAEGFKLSAFSRSPPRPESGQLERARRELALRAPPRDGSSRRSCAPRRGRARSEPR